MSFRAVAWDIDGTLVDSEPLHLRALLATCASYGVDISDLPDDEFVGVNLYGVWQTLKDRFPPNLPMQEWIEALNGNYVAEADRLIPMPQAKEVVAELSRGGIDQIAVSNSHRPIVDVNLRAAGIAEFMEFSLSLDDVPVGKPSPVPYLMATEKLGLLPNEIIAVEDSLSGIQSAKAAGLVALGIAHGRTSFPTADRTIEGLAEVIVFIGGPSVAHRDIPGDFHDQQ